MSPLTESARTLPPAPSTTVRPPETEWKASSPFTDCASTLPDTVLALTLPESPTSVVSPLTPLTSVAPLMPETKAAALTVASWTRVAAGTVRVTVALRSQALRPSAEPVQAFQGLPSNHFLKPWEPFQGRSS